MLPASGIMVLSYSVSEGHGHMPRIGYIKTGKSRRKKKSNVAKLGATPRRKPSKKKAEN